MIDLTHYGRPASEGMTATWTDDVLTIKVPIRDSVERVRALSLTCPISSDPTA